MADFGEIAVRKVIASDTAWAFLAVVLAAVRGLGGGRQGWKKNHGLFKKDSPPWFFCPFLKKAGFYWSFLKKDVFSGLF